MTESFMEQRRGAAIGEYNRHLPGGAGPRVKTRHRRLSCPPAHLARRQPGKEIRRVRTADDKIFQLVCSATREPIVSVRYKEEIQRQEFFPYDVRVRTGYQFAPLSGHGHTVALTKTAESGWRIANVGRWIS